jgi:tetratricopeptide (TPR) repeat protein
MQAKERLVLATALQVVDDKRKEADFTFESLSISRSHFDKINSVLLKKVYNTLTDGSFNSIVTLLHSRGLSSLLLHYIEIEHRKIKGVEDNDQKKNFYKTVFETLRRFPLDILDLKVLRKYADLLKPLLNKSDTDSPLVIDLKYVYIVNAAYFFKVGLKYVDAALQNVIELVPNPDKYSGDPVYSHYHLNLSVYYRDYKNEFEKAIYHIREAIENSKKCALGKDDAFMANLYGLLGTALCQNSEFDKALTIYQKAYTDYAPLITRSHYHNYLYPTTAIICGNFDVAIRHMDTYIKPFLTAHSQLYFKFDAIRLYALYYMHVGNLPEAYKYIQQALSIKRSEMTEAGDIMYRMAENIYFLLHGDYELAVNMAKKNMRFLKRKEYDFDNNEHTHLFYAAGELAKMRLKQKYDTDRISEHINACQKGVLSIFGSLLNKV